MDRLQLQQAYITKERAAEILQRSPRRVLELANSGLIRVRESHNPDTKRRQTVLLLEDVLRLRDQRSGTAIASPMAGAALRSQFQPAVTPLSVAPSPAAPWKTIDEGQLRTGLPASYLLNLVVTGELPACDVGVRPGGRFRIHERDLDAIQGERRMISAAACGAA